MVPVLLMLSRVTRVEAPMSRAASHPLFPFSTCSHPPSQFHYLFLPPPFLPLKCYASACPCSSSITFCFYLLFPSQFQYSARFLHNLISFHTQSYFISQCALIHTHTLFFCHIQPSTQFLWFRSFFCLHSLSYLTIFLIFFPISSYLPRCLPVLLPQPHLTTGGSKRSSVIKTWKMILQIIPLF